MNQERRDQLIAAVLNQRADSGQLIELSEMARFQPEIWDELAEFWRDGQNLSAYLETRLSAVSDVVLPSGAATAAAVEVVPATSIATVASAALRLDAEDADITPSQRAISGEEAGRRRKVIARLSAWSGWVAAAAAILLAVDLRFNTQPVSPLTGDGGVTTANVAMDTDAAYHQYFNTGKAEGRILGALPNRVIESHPDTSGNGTDVVFLRQIVERAHVNSLTAYKVVAADNGVPGVVPVSNVAYGGSSSPVY